MAHPDAGIIQLHLFTGEGHDQRQAQANGEPPNCSALRWGQPGQWCHQGEVEADQGEPDYGGHGIAHRSSAEPGKGSSSAGGW